MAAVRPSSFPFLFLIILCSLFVVSVAVTEEEALLQFKRSFKDGKGKLDSWNPGSPPCKGWTGVICVDGIITGLHLSDLGLSGEIDIDALIHVKGLRTLSFVNNAFTGMIPEFSRLGAAKALLLSKNQFSGEIPPDFFASMQSLKKIWLSDNNFTGKIPDSIGKLPYLLELHLEKNQFSGPIPDLREDNKITSLDLSSNKLEGEIPAILSKFSPESFAGNDGLCGKPLDKICSDAAKTDGSQSDPSGEGSPAEEPHQKRESKAIFWTVLGLLAVGAIFSAIYSSKRRRETDFSVLGKEVVHDAVEIHIPSSKNSRVASSKKGSVSKKGSSKGGKSDMGDLVLVNDERGPFGLSDLMKAAAEVLGNGGLGSAYKAVMANGLSVVVKRMREMNKLGRDGFDAEMRRFGSLRHPNISTPLAYHYRKEEKLLVSEFVPRGSLLYVLHGDRGISHAELTWPTRLKIIQGIARGLGFLHTEFSSHELPHGNLKSSNVLLSDTYEPLLSDYAFDPLINSPQAAQAMFAYKAPEYIRSQKITPKCDVYCLGIVILEIITGKFPSQYLSNGKGGIDVVQWVRSGIAENREEEVIDPEIGHSTDSKHQILKLLQIGTACTETDPEQRPDVREAIRSIEEV